METVTLHELKALEATFYDNPGDVVVMGIIADWLDENGYEKTAFAYRWCAKNQKWPQVNPPGYLWNGVIGDVYRDIGHSLERECDHVLRSLGREASRGVEIPLQLRLTDNLPPSLPSSRLGYTHSSHWTNPLRAGMYSLGEALNMRDLDVPKKPQKANRA